MKRFVHMTGPHPAGKRRVWKVALVSTHDRVPTGTVYEVLSYGRAVALSCNMARDRRLYLHIEALSR